ncbi:Glycosyltransferase, catalytic subunit of cellulose synthase and poly-beta-1,6-N-acetylglucosamine synthase [Geodermatophilus pulveris]|uniref:Glycosyltransferase, catalytic subunit of cellulose synthase and poly-beta-1,6-N-acetylglucosamine synthase n=1 Tax=Geodermatophilus pulveris TaxID=1564159 RepID=A0A239DHW5_9ACTN|nr:cellulose synthase catalytic subunit [Geodermatophilus pulveris]SNS31541.1 Glycosyltransferase, catalytic subunit of cellulose synthase and poly-beta-1,6-N-acetylglucosamine synthase [Geodermatophilus pulveris]
MSECPSRLAAYPYDDFSELAGPLQEPAADGRVRFRQVTRGAARLRAWVLVTAALVFEVLFLLFLLRPANHPEFSDDWPSYLAMGLIGSIAVIEGLRLVNVFTLAVATLNARDPVPTAPLTGQRVAFITTIVPSKEPIEMVRRTLEAAVRVRYEGTFDVWLLDEGDDPAVRAMCAEVGVRHFTRHGVPEWNRETGPHKARTKHGNYNAWLDAHGDDYDFWLSVDSDHVPLPNFAERLMGYFHDPDVAFVVGPQVYGNYDNFVTRAAESQQYLFHSVLQRAANRFGAAMFVGTNNAVRLSALRAIGGLQDSITEDAATSIVWHSRRNPETGTKWRSVYTPDVLAVGEGPSTWQDYFVQQGRWARGTDEVVLRRFWRMAWRLSFWRRAHYGLLMSYYPAAAISWVLGVTNVVAYLLTGVAGLLVPAQLWLMLYVNAAVLQVGVYFWNRRHNVSPHEEEGSSGVSGMAISVMSTPMYVSALWAAVRGRNISFAVTRKGAVSGDRIGSFAKNLWWAGLLVLALGASELLGNDHPAIRAWALLTLSMSLLPVAIWVSGLLGTRLRPAPRPVPQPVPQPVPVVGPPAPAVTFVGNHVVDVPVPQESTR